MTNQQIPNTYCVHSTGLAQSGAGGQAGGVVRYKQGGGNKISPPRWGKGLHFRTDDDTLSARSTVIHHRHLP